MKPVLEQIIFPIKLHFFFTTYCFLVHLYKYEINLKSENSCINIGQLILKYIRFVFIDIFCASTFIAYCGYSSIHIINFKFLSIPYDFISILMDLSKHQ